jgi:tetratricopeptide (TPR) repeat protein
MSVKNIIYSVITVTVFFGALEFALAVSGVRPVLLSEDPLVGFAENIPLFVEDTRPDGAIMLRTAPYHLRMFNYQEFPREKAGNSYRIFCMGGSTTHGRPFYDPVSFCGWLRAYLTAADPTRNWEVINAGGISYASYRVAKLMKEFRQYEPDLFIVYTGQNEFLEERSYGNLINLPVWAINLNATLSGTRTYTAMKYVIDRLQSDPFTGAQQRTMLDGDVDEILNHTIGPESYHRDDSLKQQIITHFQLNMMRMVSLARDAGADIIFVKPAINIKDMSPFKSEHRDGLTADAGRQWDTLFERARALHDAGEFNTALAVYREALGIDDRHAELHYRTGQVLFELGQYAEAETAFRRAVEEDIVPLRILDSMQEIVEAVAARETVPLVDFPAIIREAYLDNYDHAIFGKEYFRDHVHTDMEGYRLLGLALFDQLARQGVVMPDAAWNDTRRQQIEQKVVAGLEPGFEGRTSVMLGKVFEWAGKVDEAYAQFKRAFEILGPSPMIYDRLARSSFLRGKHDAAIHYLRKSLELDPAVPGVHMNLALILGTQGKTDEAIEHCRAELELNPASHSVHAGLASLLEKKGDDTAALEHYAQSIELRPDYEYALIQMAYLLIRQNRHDEALGHAREVLRINPDNHRAHNALGLIMQEQGEAEQARREFSAAARLKAGYKNAEENLHRAQMEHTGTKLAVDLSARR